MISEIKEDKPVLLFSSGLDSYIIKFLEKIPDEQCLFADMDTAENTVERAKLDWFFPTVTQIKLPLNSFALENYIIPYRNHMLALMGFQFSNQVIFAFTAGDTTRDKDYVFKAQIEGITSYFGGVPEKVRVPGPYQLLMPYKSYTKGDLVKAYLASGGSGENLLIQSTSCYIGSSSPYGCGTCRSCLRKFVAIATASLSLSQKMRKGLYTNPIQHLENFYEESKIKCRSRRELEEIEFCLKKIS